MLGNQLSCLRNFIVKISSRTEFRPDQRQYHGHKDCRHQPGTGKPLGNRPAAPDKHREHYKDCHNDSYRCHQQFVQYMQHPGHQAPAPELLDLLPLSVDFHVFQIFIIHCHAFLIQRSALYFLHIFQFPVKKHNGNSLCRRHKENPPYTGSRITGQFLYPCPFIDSVH